MFSARFRFPEAFSRKMSRKGMIFIFFPEVNPEAVSRKGSFPEVLSTRKEVIFLIVLIFPEEVPEAVSREGSFPGSLFPEADPEGANHNSPWDTGVFDRRHIYMYCGNSPLLSVCEALLGVP